MFARKYSELMQKNLTYKNDKFFYSKIMVRKIQNYYQLHKIIDEIL